jgi:hypothetical protein
VTITQLDPISVAFSLPQRNLGQVLATLRDGRRQGARDLPRVGRTADGQAPLRRQHGRCELGHRAVKAEFANKDERLWPGAFVNIRLAVEMLKGASVVPQVAIIQSPRGKIVYVVDAANKATARPVEVLYGEGMDAAVSGVKPGERVVVDGRQNLRPDRLWSSARPPTPRRGRRGGASAASGANGASAARRGGVGGAVGLTQRGRAMNLSELFIRRPVLTVLLNAAIVLAGVIAWRGIRSRPCRATTRRSSTSRRSCPAPARRRWRARSRCSSRSSSRRFPAWP